MIWRWRFSFFSVAGDFWVRFNWLLGWIRSLPSQGQVWRIGILIRGSCWGRSGRVCFCDVLTVISMLWLHCTTDSVQYQAFCFLAVLLHDHGVTESCPILDVPLVRLWYEKGSVPCANGELRAKTWHWGWSRRYADPPNARRATCTPPLESKLQALYLNQIPR